MYIPLKKDNIKLIPLRENQDNTNNDILLEKAHAFDEQYTWAWKTAELIYEGLIKKLKNIKVTFKNNTDENISGAKIDISNNNNIMKTSSYARGFDNEGYFLIGIDVNKDILNKDENSAINEIWDSIVHELGYSNVFWKQYYNKNKVEEAPEEYENWNKIISNENIEPNDIAYLFCYALYSTYYQEMQAFTSQIYSSLIVKLNELFGTTKNITKQQFWRALINTNTYQTYKSNISIAEKLINSLGLRNILSKKLATYGLNYNEKQILKKSKEIKIKSINTLHDAYNNAYQYFYKSFEK